MTPPNDPANSANSAVPLNERTAGELALARISFPVGCICPSCCHWSLPVSGARPDLVLNTDGKRGTRFNVALMYHEWLVYHLHVVTHQRLDQQMTLSDGMLRIEPPSWAIA